MKIRFCFVGERRSRTAIRMKVRWQDGRLAAKQLFDALRAVGLDPNDHEFFNWWEQRHSRQYIRDRALEGVTIVAMGKKVHQVLVENDVPHQTIIHPAARGRIRNKARYAEHIREVLCG